jgi:GDP-D-mannose dehydratase
MKKALITGITGQDGSYLAEFFETFWIKFIYTVDQLKATRLFSMLSLR